MYIYKSILPENVDLHVIVWQAISEREVICIGIYVNNVHDIQINLHKLFCDQTLHHVHTYKLIQTSLLSNCPFLNNLSI